MSRTKLPARLQLKLDDETRLMLEELATAMGVDMSAAIRVTIREKCRALGITAPAAATSAPTAKPKSRAAR